MDNYLKKLARALGIKRKAERRAGHAQKSGRFIPPQDPFAARSKMDIAYTSDLHRDLYTPVRRNMPEQNEHLWNAFLERYPQFEPLRAEWLASRGEGVTPLSHGLPWIAYDAITYLNENVRPDFKVFEWGMGGSTVFWSTRVREIISVEHDTEWFGLASEAITALGEGQTQPTLKLCAPDAAEAPAYASGRQEYSAQSFETYVKAVNDFPMAYFDLVVVDGRARMACLRQSVERVAPGGVILLDNSDYARYQAELERFWAEHQQTFDRQDFLSPTPFAANIGSQTTIFTRKTM